MKTHTILPFDLMVEIALMALLTIGFTILGYLSREFAIDMQTFLTDSGWGAF